MGTERRIRRSVLARVGLLGLAVGLLALEFIVGLPPTVAVQAQAEAEAEGCLRCHQGIEPINPKMDFACTVCHRGDGQAVTKEEAHTGLIPNPGAMDVVTQGGGCAQCHQDYVERLKKSLHATSAGKISAARYTWAAQDIKNAIYGNYAVQDEDGDVPAEKGALPELRALPTFKESGQPVDDYLRNQCLRCHVWTEGAKRYGDYRSSGCSACHVVYADDGLYRGDDPTIPKDKPDHPIRHEITTKIPSYQCVHCHNRGGRTGVSYLGLMEADPYGTPFTETGDKQPKLHGKWYNRLTPDVHYQKGMECIDCHTSRELHGDGNIYSKKEQAVEIECENCHGTVAERSSMTTSWGNPIPNLQEKDGQIVLISKMTGEARIVPQLKDLAEQGKLSPAGKTAMVAIPQHMQQMECYSCHARWAPQCYGCHAKQDLSKPAKDWLTGEQTAFQWSESRSYLRWESPTLGINAEGKVAPFIPGCQAIFTQIGEDGEVKVLNKVFTTADGTSGIAHNPIQPHTVSKESRTCTDCHNNPKALGLGSGFYDPQANGLPIDFELERIVDEEGRQIQATSHEGARPFTQEEQQKISRVGTCIGCHQDNSDPIWQDVQAVVGIAANPEQHMQIMRRALHALPSTGTMTLAGIGLLLLLGGGVWVHRRMRWLGKGSPSQG